MDDALRAHFTSVPYHASLGLQVESVDTDRARLRLPFRDANANPGQVLHGGVTASTIDAAGMLAACAALAGAPTLRCSTLDLSVNYLAAAIGEEITASAEVLRRGKELVYSEIDVRTLAGKRIAIGLSTVRGFDAAANPLAAERQLAWPPPVEASGSGLISGARAFVTSPFMASLGIEVEMADGGAARLAMPSAANLADGDGAIHAGAVAALIDSSGALAAWSIVGLDMRFKASTVGIHVTFHDRAPRQAAVAHARTLRRNNEIFLNQVAVVTRDSGTLLATGTVTYRIVMP